MAAKPMNELEETSKSSGLIRQFLAAASEIHGRDVTPLMLSAYESALADIPGPKLRSALNAALRDEKFWPTPGHIRERIEADREGQNAIEAEQAWGGVMEHIRAWGIDQLPVFCGGKIHRAPAFDERTETAIRACGGYRAIANTPDANSRFVRKVFLDAYARDQERERRGELSDGEARGILGQLEAAKVTR